jgi:polysaccharide biosynthesis/export protein
MMTVTQQPTTHLARRVCLGAVGLCIALSLTGTAAAQAEPGPQPAAPAGQYVIGIGDVLDVIVAGEAELTHTGTAGLTVGPDGRVGFSPIGMVEAAGQTCEQLAATIREKLTSTPRWLVDPHVTVSVATFNALRVNVIGAVRTPGSFPHRPGLLVRDAIALAGGLVVGGEGGASKMRARLVHSDGSSVPVRLDQALAGEGEDGLVQLKPADTLVVEIQMMISVLGYVRTPGLLPLQDGTRVSEAIGLAGGITADGDLKLVAIRRLAGGVETVNVEECILSSTPEPVLSNGDTVFVPRRVKDEVSVQGYVEKPGKYEIQLEAQRTVSDLLAEAGGASPRPTTAGGSSRGSAGDLTHVTLTRASGEVLTLNIADVLDGKATTPDANPVVGAGDSIFVPEERTEITVLGHVVRPGRYLLIPGDRVSDALATAGGPIRPTELPARTTSADLAHASLFRASGETIALDLSLILTGQGGYPNPELEPGDTLVIPEAKNRVSVGGYVANAGYFEFRPGEKVSSAIAMAGGVLNNVGSRSNVTIKHSDGTTEHVDLAQADPDLRPLDEILVAFARNRVAVVGYVQRPGLFEWHEGDTVVEAIANAGGAIPRSGTQKGGDFNRAAVIRIVEGEQQILQLELGKYFKDGDQTANVVLLPDDVVYVPRSDHTQYGSWLGNLLTGLSGYNLAKILFF